MVQLEYLTFDELRLYALQLTDYRKYDIIKDKILSFRKEKSNCKGRYRQFLEVKLTEAILDVYGDRIASGNTKLRESNDSSLDNFVNTQKNNMRDYADACFRYLRFTGLISILHQSRTLTLFKEKIKDIEYILNTVERNPVFINDEKKYRAHLFSATTPTLYTDNKDNLIHNIGSLSDYQENDLKEYDINELKDIYHRLIEKIRDEAINNQVEIIKSNTLYHDIVDMFKEIQSNKIFDPPLMLEYNTWRAMTMLDGGNIKGNFRFDDAGNPLSTAAGNQPDIECYYDDYVMSVEVTLQSGQRQYESEGEPVARHYGQFKKNTGKDAYCLFIAPKINPATLAHFFGLNQLNIALYGGKSKIIPLEINQFVGLLQKSNKRDKKSTPKDIRNFLDNILNKCDQVSDENEWKHVISKNVETWLTF